MYSTKTAATNIQLDGEGRPSLWTVQWKVFALQSSRTTRPFMVVWWQNNTKAASNKCITQPESRAYLIYIVYLITACLLCTCSSFEKSFGTRKTYEK